MRNICQNITIALGLKAVFLVTTIVGITGLWPAILADTGATVLVTINAPETAETGRIRIAAYPAPIHSERRPCGYIRSSFYRFSPRY